MYLLSLKRLAALDRTNIQFRVNSRTNWKKMTEKMLANRHMIGTFTMTLRMCCL